MTKTKEIIRYCEDYLKVKDFEDGCNNGLQIEGVHLVKKIVTGVSLSKKFINEAINKKADMLMVHHGLFDNHIGKPAVIKGVMRNRIKILLENDINLAGFHLPLDAHPEIGNNISLARLMNLENIKPFDIGFVGDIKETDINAFIKRVEERFITKTFSILGGPKKVKRVGIISGGASPYYKQAIEEGADTFICGDMRENTVREAEEAEVNIINAGHYNTEKLGIQNLGNLVAEKFGVDVEFVDIPNDI